jgi:hypothetical protein
MARNSRRKTSSRSKRVDVSQSRTKAYRPGEVWGLAKVLAPIPADDLLTRYHAAEMTSRTSLRWIDTPGRTENIILDRAVKKYGSCLRMPESGMLVYLI